MAVLLVTALVCGLLLPPWVYLGLLEDLPSVAFYVGNWHFLQADQDYFAQGAAPSPVLHFWSLAVEEQFYLIWPLALLGLLAVSRGRPGRLALLLLCLLAASVALAVGIAQTDPGRAHYGTDARAYQLLLGAALAAPRPAAPAPAARSAVGGAPRRVGAGGAVHPAL